MPCISVDILLHNRRLLGICMDRFLVQKAYLARRAGCHHICFHLPENNDLWDAEEAILTAIIERTQQAKMSQHFAATFFSVFSRKLHCTFRYR